MDNIPKPVIIAIREQLMAYFKGYCHDPLVQRSLVRVAPTGHDPMQYQYQREINQYAGDRILYLDSWTLATMNKRDKTFKWDMARIGLSEELRMVHREVNRFLQEYLGGVQVSEDGVMSEIDTNIRHEHLVADENVGLTNNGRIEERDGYIRLFETVATNGF